MMYPSFKDEYFKLAKWEPTWIAEAIRLAREMWVSIYKPKQPTNPKTVPARASKPRTSMLAGLGNAASTQGGNFPTNALDVWLAGGLILDRIKPVNPIRWWLHQKRSGNMHGGLIDMALDVLNCPCEFKMFCFLCRSSF
ncbi:hypothetical protein PTTG_07139 [Puccinia triticina 1-1 BBBD Race 1]|uniref:Uncharacterized protein n=1 Tax=Puccinia triticina (isolate 1-1 / race 1 (BBBD)) TaxID=630390 RepID=A0A180GFY4_PUCT1|nr:hypothetical protein PTTG_07139 [Puccinia triticina 1-1 BBBD Race 1]